MLAPMAATGESGPAPGRVPRARLTLIATILGSGISLVDGSIVAVALPTIQRDLGGGLAAQQWVSNAYLLTLGSLMLVGGALGDRYGERRVFALGVSGFGVASALCALAPTIGLLVAARVLQGVAGALLTPSSLAVIVSTFPERERGAAIGTWTAYGSIATIIGPLAGGELLAFASWRWLFVINLPLVAVCLALIAVAVPRGAPRGAEGGAIDVLGALLCVLGIAGPIFALIEAPRLGWSNPAVLGSLCIGASLLLAFVLVERRVKAPMLPLGLFARRQFTASNLETFALYGGLGIFFFFIVLFLQQVAGYTPLRSGLATIPVTIVMFTLSRRFGALATRLGPRLFMGLGPLIGAAGLLLALRIGSHPRYLTSVLPAVAVFALGLSMTVAPLTMTVLANVEGSRAGIASAINNATARLAGLTGTAAVGALVSAHFASAFGAGVHRAVLGLKAREALAAAERLVLGVPPLRGVPAAQARVLRTAADAAAVSSFHLAIAIAAALCGLGGMIGALWISNAKTPARHAPHVPLS